ncbi:MAG: hypothetical protein LC754_09635 [Acidobacteria bacterium]|nr:hypothetical protein [Acidobacteriota bacterium]
MFIKTVFVGLCCLCALSFAGCHSGFATGGGPTVEEVRRSGPSPEPPNGENGYEPPVVLASLEDRAIDESSGIVASRRNPGLFWTHNDSGDGPFLYAFDRQGRGGGVWRVGGASARDWEDIATGPGPQPGTPYLYVGDIGDNGRKRAEVVVYRVAEPLIAPEDALTSKTNPRATETADALRLKYPDGSHDAETLLIHPQTGDLYIVIKTTQQTSKVYRARAPLSTSTTNALEFVMDLRVPSVFAGLITGGDISPDGRRVVLCDYVSAYELRPGDANAGNFDDIWKQPPVTVALGERVTGESVCYSLDGASLLATSERTPTPLIEVKAKGKK